jgi:hypothetical protein
MKTGKTTVLDAGPARTLLDSIDISTVVGLRDRALIALMNYSFAASARWRWMSRTTFARANDGGSACTKEAARTTSCPLIIISMPIMNRGGRHSG